MQAKGSQRLAGRNRRWVRVLVLAAVTVGFGSVLAPQSASAAPFEIKAKQIPYFQINASNHQFGKLEYMGGLLTWSDEPTYGGISSIRFKDDKQSFLAVTDTGYFISGRIERDTGGKLSGISSANITPMLDPSGNIPKRKYMVDAEGIALRGHMAYVSYEQRHRIDIFDTRDLENARPVGRLPHLIPNRELRSNGAIETIAAAPQDSSLQGAMVIVAEYSVDEQGNHFAAVLEGPLKGLFSVVRRDDFAVTDGAFLPNGDLILLERRFNFAQGIGMRIRRIAGKDIVPGAVVDGEVLIQAGMAHQIDNMEGLDVVTMPDGSTHLIIVSDDNLSFLQRNLMLEFKLLD